MKKNARIFLEKTLGSDFDKLLHNDLSKSEVFKPGTRSVTDTNDLFQGLQIVPRTLLKLLNKELSPMQIGDTKEIKIPGKEETIIIVTKNERDSYSGQIIQNNVKLNDFIQRSLPGIGLILMTVLELYNFEDFEKEISIDAIKQTEINKIIDERLNLHSLVNKVVDGKIMQKEAFNQLFINKLNELYKEQIEIKKDHEKIMDEKKETKPSVVIELKKIRPLTEFIENRKNKINKKEHFIKMQKSEEVFCPDCGNVIFSEGVYSGCICFGLNDKKLYIKKSEEGIKVRFGKGWDLENTEMLLEILRNKKNG